MKCLIIDDDRDFIDGIMDRLEMRDHIFDFRYTPEGGVQMANEIKNYDLIFIDFRFKSEPNYTGADVGLRIRRNNPLSTLILMTAWGKEEIKNYIFVGFDNYWSKYDEGDGEDLDKMMADFDETIEKALLNAQRRCKSIFSEDELKEMESYLDAIQETIEFLENSDCKNIINCHTITAGIQLLKKEPPLSLDRQIFQAIAKSKELKSTLSTYKLVAYNTFSSSRFELREKGSYTDNALKIRQLLKSNPDKWLKARGFNKSKGKAYYNPIYAIAQEFSV